MPVQWSETAHASPHMDRAATAGPAPALAQPLSNQPSLMLDCVQICAHFITPHWLDRSLSARYGAHRDHSCAPTLLFPSLLFPAPFQDKNLPSIFQTLATNHLIPCGSPISCWCLLNRLELRPSSAEASRIIDLVPTSLRWVSMRSGATENDNPSSSSLPAQSLIVSHARREHVHTHFENRARSGRWGDPVRRDKSKA